MCLWFIVTYNAFYSFFASLNNNTVPNLFPKQLFKPAVSEMKL